jgi:hypothetical protein
VGACPDALSASSAVTRGCLCSAITTTQNSVRHCIVIAMPSEDVEGRRAQRNRRGIQVVDRMLREAMSTQERADYCTERCTVMVSYPCSDWPGASHRDLDLRTAPTYASDRSVRRKSERMLIEDKIYNLYPQLGVPCLHLSSVHDGANPKILSFCTLKPISRLSPLP